MPRFIMLCGLPASGKSTYAETFVGGAKTPTMLLSSDSIVQDMADENGITYQEAYAQWAAKAQEEVLSRATYAIADGVDVVWDQTNLTPEQRACRVAMFEEAEYELIAVAFEASQAVLKTRISNRAQATGKTIPDAVLEAMAKSYVRPSADEGFDHLVIVTPEGARPVF